MTAYALDLSLTATGWACITEGGAVTTGTIKSAKAPAAVKEKREETYRERHDRIANLAARIGQAVPRVGGSVIRCDVTVEGPAYGSTGRHGSVWDRAGLWWTVEQDIRAAGGGWSVCPPGTLKRWATGKGSAAKEQVMMAAGRMWPELDIQDDNQADALWMAHMTAVLAGYPVLKRSHQVPAILSKVEWHG